MKRIIAILLCAAFVFGLTACGEKSTDDKPKKEAVKMSVACLKGPTGVGMAKLMDGKNNANDYTFTVASAADEISGKIVTGEINIASVPTNLAAKLYNKTGGNIVMLAVNTLGVLSVIEDGNSVKSVADLKGKTIYSTGEGSNPEYILRHLLKENGLDPKKDVKIQFLASNDELSAALISGKAKIALVPEPVATTVLIKKPTLSRALSVESEWEKISDSEVMMGCVVTLKSYAEQNGEAIKNFLKEYKNSIDFAKENPEKAAVLCEKYEIIPAAKIAEASIPNCNLTFASGKNIKAEIDGYFKVLLNADPSFIGGKLPDENFYYEAK